MFSQSFLPHPPVPLEGYYFPKLSVPVLGELWILDLFKSSKSKHFPKTLVLSFADKEQKDVIKFLISFLSSSVWERSNDRIISSELWISLEKIVSVYVGMGSVIDILFPSSLRTMWTSKA